MCGYLVPFAFLYANLNALENVEVPRAYGIDLINFCISCLYVEHFGNVFFVPGLHRRDKEIAMVGETYSGQSLPDSRIHSFPD